MHLERNVAGAFGVGMEIQIDLDRGDAMNTVAGRNALKHTAVGRHEYPHVGAPVGWAEGQIAEIVESVLMMDVNARGPKRGVST